MSTRESSLVSRTPDTERGTFDSPNSYVYVHTPMANINTSVGLKSTVNTTLAEEMDSSYQQQTEQQHQEQHRQQYQQPHEQYQQHEKYRQPQQPLLPHRHQQQHHQFKPVNNQSSLAQEVRFDYDNSPPALKDKTVPFQPAAHQAKDQSHGFGFNTEESSQTYPHQEKPGTRTVSSPVGTTSKYGKTPDPPLAEVNWRDRSVSHGSGYGRGSYLRGSATHHSQPFAPPNRYYPPGYYLSPANRWNPKFRSRNSASASTEFLATLTSNVRKQPATTHQFTRNRFSALSSLYKVNNDENHHRMSESDRQLGSNIGSIGDGRFGAGPTSSVPSAPTLINPDAPVFIPRRPGPGMTHNESEASGFNQPQPSGPAYHADTLASHLGTFSLDPGPTSTAQALGAVPPFPAQQPPFPAHQAPFSHHASAPFFRPLASVPETAVVPASSSSSSAALVHQAPHDPSKPFFFRPMECRTHRRLSELEAYDLMIKGFSPNYKGNPDLDRNRSATISEDMNCSLFLVGLPPTVTTHELLQGVRNVGRVYATHINPPEPEKGHEQAAAKVVFFERAAAGTYPSRVLCHVHLVPKRMPMRLFIGPSKRLDVPLGYPQHASEKRFYHMATTTGFRLPTYPPPQHPIRVTWNRIRSAEVDPTGLKSRVLLISGPPSIVNEEHLRAYFDRKLIYQVDEIIVHHPGAAGPALPAPPTLPLLGPARPATLSGSGGFVPGFNNNPGGSGGFFPGSAGSGGLVPGDNNSGGVGPGVSVAGHSNTSSGSGGIVPGFNNPSGDFSGVSGGSGGMIPGFNNNFGGGSSGVLVAGHSNNSSGSGGLIPGDNNNGGPSSFVPGHSKNNSSGGGNSSVFGQLKGDRALIEFRFGSYRCQSEAARMALVREFREYGVLCEFGKDPCDRVEEKEEKGKGKEQQQQEEEMSGGGGGFGGGFGGVLAAGGVGFDGAGFGGEAVAGGAGVGVGGFGSLFTPAGANATAMTPAGSFFQSRAQSESVRALWGEEEREEA
ncbi:hypothetical protein QBC40DRAFT_200640 [Triangularia verruculosa]|uniref:RRM domain-containing protein n=1 Tax=Triangularia verruculosa TaxID=2587418 RepID=A0AAN6XIR2_9PEZI|nr:hypothetical protein QBC40DRAFT_200640 [Triangularia verruculosa]